MQSQLNKQHFLDIPVGELGIVGMKGCSSLSAKVDEYISSWRQERQDQVADEYEFIGYNKPSYLVSHDCPRFASGESKGVINQSVRGDDLYIICDCYNYDITYTMYGRTVYMGPDDHFQDLKRLIAAIGKKARRINVIMPMLYGGRQHKRNGRESLDCAIMLQDLQLMGVDNIITFDAHDPRVANAIPITSFENMKTNYQFLKALLKTFPDIEVKKDKLMIISPDEGALDRAIYYSSVLGVDMGLFYKRRDYSRVVNGRNPIVKHEFLGDSVEGKDVLIADDIISSGDSSLEIAEKLKAEGAKRIFVCATFGLFTDGMEIFDRAYENGIVDRVLTTNLVYQSPQLLSKPWYVSVDLSKYIAYIIEHLNHDRSLSMLVDPTARISALLERYRAEHKEKNPQQQMVLSV